MRKLHCVAGILVVLAFCRAASAAPIHDDFSADTSANYTPIAGLARSGSVLPTLTIAGGELALTTPGHGSGSTGVTQTYILHNSATLAVGETLLLDVDLLNSAFGSNSSEMIGLTVVAQGSFPGVTPVPPASNQDVRDTQVANLFAGFRNSGGRDTFRTDGYNGPLVAGGTITEGNLDVGVSSSNTDMNLTTISSVFISRLATDDYAMGWIENNVTPHVVRTVTMDLGATPRVGIFTDTRNNAFNQSVDNFRILSSVPEPHAMVLTTLGAAVLGLLTRKART